MVRRARDLVASLSFVHRDQVSSVYRLCTFIVFGWVHLDSVKCKHERREKEEEKLYKQKKEKKKKGSDQYTCCS